MDDPSSRLRSHGAVRAAGVAKTFVSRSGDEITALAGVDLHIEPGEFVSLVGPSGCGKSTLLQILAGLQPASEGVVEIDGTPMVAPRQKIGMMFQHAQLFPWKTALDNTLLPIDVFRLPRADYRERARDLLELVGLGGFEGAYPRELSGGMQQRVALSRMLIGEPDLLLMDEPFGALDEMTRERMNLELLRIWSEAQKTVVFVTHNIGEAVFLSDRIIVMGTKPGRILSEIQVPLPRPRYLEQLRIPAYVDTVFSARRDLDNATETRAATNMDVG